MRWLYPLLFASIPGCNAVLGVEELSRAADPVAETQACSACGVDSCASERAACRGDVACLEVYACVGACALDDIVCRSSCERSRSGGSSKLWHALDGCRRVNCTDECYGSHGLGRLVDKACDCTDAICEPFIRNCIRSGELRAGEDVGDCERRMACLATRPRPVDPDDAVGCTLAGWKGEAEANTIRFCWQGAACGTCPMAGGQMNACVAQYQWSRPPVDTDVDFGVTISDLHGHVVAGAEVVACEAVDCASCDGPVAKAKSGADGVAHMKLSTFGGGFRGCFQVKAPGKLDMLWYAGRPISRGEAVLRFPSFGPEDLAAYTGPSGVPVDGTRGQMVIATRDCIVSPASGLFIDNPGTANTVVMYLRNGTPTKDGPTDDTGQAGIVNVVPGLVDVVVRHADHSEQGHMKVSVRTGWVTGVFVFPDVQP